MLDRFGVFSGSRVEFSRNATPKTTFSVVFLAYKNYA
jgi:hypothetical protein